MTLQRSNTTAGSSLHYRSTSIQALHRSSATGNYTLPRGPLMHVRGGGKSSKQGQKNSHRFSSSKGSPYATSEEICEFQAGPSFDLPKIEDYRNRYVMSWGRSKNADQFSQIEPEPEMNHPRSSHAKMVLDSVNLWILFEWV